MIYSSYRDRWCIDYKWVGDRLIYDRQFIDKYVFILIINYTFSVLKNYK